MLQGTPKYVQITLKEVLVRLNWIMFPQYLHLHNIFSENFQKVVLTPRRDNIESSGRKHHRRQKTSVYLQKKNKKQDIKPEVMDHILSNLST